jgi:hypothetical protein
MTVEQAVQSALVNFSGLTSIIPSDRIRVAGEHVELTDPYLIHGPDRERTQPYLSGGYTDLRAYEYAVSVFARSLATANQASEQARAALGSMQGDAVAIVGGSAPSYDADTRLHAITIEATIWIAP